MTTRNMEDYLEAIWNLQDKKGYVKAKDIADKLEVTRPSVSEMIKKLSENEYIIYEKYGGIIFTAKGKKLAQEIKRRHTLLVEFLKIIGVDEQNAQQDACKLEHDVSPETITCLLGFVEFISLLPESSKWKENFQEYLKKKGLLERSSNKNKNYKEKILKERE
ncbi:transcriptional regulator MntR [bacterium]|nr:transcriptional regulator MntR [bacterium]MBU4362097.1 transcriptional regulator MntR [bacterium]MBU4602469.1 transcriptional regulator MntR [bacterium]